MSLLSESMEDFIVMNKQIVDDGYGGYTTTWTDGVTIAAAAVLDTSMEARVAGVQGVTSLYTITTTKAINLDYHDVVRRVSDNQIFRITSNGNDKKTPNSAGLNMRQVTAEEWRLQND